MITHHGIWAIAHILSRSSSKHSCIPGAYHCKHLLIPCPTNTIVGHILAIVSNKRVAPFLDQGANWFGAPATNARRVSEANRIFNRTNPPIVAKIKDCENCTHAKSAQFLNNWQRFFFRHTFAIQVVNYWPTPIANSLRSGTRHAVCSRARVPRNHPPNQEDPNSVHDIWTVTHMLASQVATPKCFHCVNKVSYS